MYIGGLLQSNKPFALPTTEEEEVEVVVVEEERIIPQTKLGPRVPSLSSLHNKTNHSSYFTTNTSSSSSSSATVQSASTTLQKVLLLIRSLRPSRSLLPWPWLVTLKLLLETHVNDDYVNTEYSIPFPLTCTCCPPSLTPLPPPPPAPPWFIQFRKFPPCCDDPGWLFGPPELPPNPCARWEIKHWPGHSI